jgi:hypothetical protein
VGQSTTDERSEQQARSQLESIRDMVAALDVDYDRLAELAELVTESEDAEERAELRQELDALKKAAGECTSADEARQRIEEDPLSVQVRSGWYNPGASDEDRRPEEFEILLCTGGPACRIVGRLDANLEPESARIQHQDWGTPWTEFFPEGDVRDALLTYARCFYFGE